MNARFILIATAALSSTAFAADAPKSQVQAAAQSKAAPAQVLLASADTVRAPSPRDDSASAPKPRGRVSTCRCGGQEPDETEEE